MRPGLFSPKGAAICVTLGFLSVGLSKEIPNVLFRVSLLFAVGVFLWLLADWATPENGGTR